MTVQPAWSARYGMLLAGALAVLSLALPWRNSHLDSGLTSVYVPGSCFISYDGYSSCETGSVGYGYYTSVGGPVPGYVGPIRVVAVLAALLMVWAWPHRSRTVARLSLGVGAAGFVLGGLTATSGHLVYALALALAAMTLNQVGLLQGTTRRWAQAAST